MRYSIGGNGCGHVLKGGISGGREAQKKRKEIMEGKGKGGRDMYKTSWLVLLDYCFGDVMDLISKLCSPL